MEIYRLTLKDKIYLFFQQDTIKRKIYLFPKVKVHQLIWFNERGLRIPLDFNSYINNYVESLLFEYDLR